MMALFQKLKAQLEKPQMQYLSDDFAFCTQISVEDVATLKKKGFATIICNRPDGEDANQPKFETLRDQAEAIGLDSFHLPVVPGNITPADVSEFRELFDNVPKPVIAFCKSGMRSKSLWQKMQS